MNILAIETSCDETSAAVIEKRGRVARVRSNIVASQIALHARTGGVVPEVAAREHVRPIMPTIVEALRRGRTAFANLDAVAVTVGPGLHTALSVGVETAKALSFTLRRPLLPVNHMLGHVAASWNNRPPAFPTLALIVSGGHTELALFHSPRRYRLLGVTADDAAGEAFDKVAQLLGLGYPGGPAVSAMAERGDPAAFALPRPMLDRDNYHFSFSGLKTAVRHQIDSRPALLASRRKVADLCASFQRAATDVLIEKTTRAARQYRPVEIVLAGGVAANAELRRRMAAAVRNLPWHPAYRQPARSLCTDNAGMIGLAAAYCSPTSRAAAWKTTDIEPTLSL